LKNRNVNIIGLFWICRITGKTGQNRYSLESLQQLAREDLNTYLKQFNKKKNTGIILTLSGAALSIGGATAISSHGFSFNDTRTSIGLGMVVSGTIVTFCTTNLQVSFKNHF
jgi:hypothetical protein